MKTELIIELIKTALAILASQLGGKPSEISVAGGLLKILSIGRAAYKAETGQDIDPEKIRPYEPME